MSQLRRDKMDALKLDHEKTAMFTLFTLNFSSGHMMLLLWRSPGLSVQAEYNEIQFCCLLSPITALRHDATTYLRETFRAWSRFDYLGSVLCPSALRLAYAH